MAMKKVAISRETVVWLLEYLESEEIDRSGMFSRQGLKELKAKQQELREALDG